MIYHQEISPFTTVGKSFEEYFFLTVMFLFTMKAKFVKKLSFFQIQEIVSYI